MPNLTPLVYIPGKNIQELFVDKATGQVMAGGYIEFWADNARTIPKTVYQESGNPEEPYVPLGSTVDLGAAGSPVDGNGNDVALYYKVLDDDGNKSLYYLDVFTAANVKRISRNRWPLDFEISENPEFNFVENFVPNGQFLIHTDNEAFTEEVTNIAMGGWVVILSSGFTSVNTVTFERFDDFSSDPESDPRYALRFLTESPNAAESRKDIALIFKNVNRFANMTLTYQVSARTNIGVPINIDLIVEKNFGTGGSASTEEFIDTFTIQPTDYEDYTKTFTLGDNSGKSIGDSDDDEIRFLLRLPTNIADDISAVNVMLVDGAFDSLDYPQVTATQDASQTLGGSINIPNPDGSDVGKALTLGVNNNSAISSQTPLAALQWTQIFFPGFTTWVPTIPNGDFLSSQGWVIQDGSTYDIVGDDADTYLALSDFLGTYNGIGVDSFYTSNLSATKVVYKARGVGTCTSPNMYSSGFSFSITTSGTTTVQQVVELTCVAASLVPAGSYFRIYSPTARSTIYWFTIDGVGTDPSGSFGGQLVKEVALLSTDTATQVANKINAAWQTQVCVPDLRGMSVRGYNNGRADFFSDPDTATRILPNSLTLGATTAVWGGGGVSNAFTATGLTTDFVATGRIVTQSGSARIISFACSADTLTVFFSSDPGANTTVLWSATSLASNVVGDLPGSYQIDTEQDHEHTGDSGSNFCFLGGAGFSISGASGVRTTDKTGIVSSTQGYRTSTETRGKNVSGTWLIKL
jgi:hypothetical protein